MVIKPIVTGSVARNAHPMGCKEAVREQIEYVKTGTQYQGAKKVLILGASSGYGLASRISAAFGGSKADTIGVSFERPGNEEKTGSAGWYNNIWFKEAAEKEGLIAKNFIGDAFSHNMRDEVIKYVKEEFGGKVDLVVYSLASGIRILPDTGEKVRSTLKPRGEQLTGPTYNVEKEIIESETLESATQEDIDNTVTVMGGEDWTLWIEALAEAGVLANSAKTFAYSYIGGDLTKDIYRGGTIGAAKEHLENTALSLDKFLKEKLNGSANVAVLRAIVTKASAFIPIFPLYATILLEVMTEMGIEENAMVHTHRFLTDMVYGNKAELDEKNRFRPDYSELREDVQDKVKEVYSKVTAENFKELIDYKRYTAEFMKLNGFGFEGVNYDDDVDMEMLNTLKP